MNPPRFRGTSRSPAIPLPPVLRRALLALCSALLVASRSGPALGQGAEAAAGARPAAPEPAPRAARHRAAGLSAGATPQERHRVRYTLDGIEIRGNVRTAARVILRYVRFRAGGVLDVEDPEIELTRYRLLGTGFFASVGLSLRKGAERGSATLVIDVVERNTFVVQDLWLGIAADEDTAGNARPLSAFTGVQAAETNLAGTGITLGAGVGLAADQLALRTRFVDPAFVGTRWSAAVTVLYNDARDFFGNRDVSFESPLLEQREVTGYAVVAYKRFGATLGTGHDVSSSLQLSLDYHLEQIDATVPTVASHMRGDRREPIDFDILGGRTVLSSLRAAIDYDTRDAPFLTTQGTLASVAVTVGVPPFGSDYGYQKFEFAAQRWFRLPMRHVLRVEAFAGAVAGDAPFFEKFYVGDLTDLLPDRLLDLAPDRRQPPNFLSTDIIEVRYGDFAAKLEAEYRIPVYAGRGSIYGVDFFGAAGLYGLATRREFTDPPTGYEGLARVPVDITYNLGLRVDTAVGGVTLAFSNLLGLIPARRGERK
ncbi:BamA/TamA family outer membrane protein [Sorangium sp. So ce185]|uniref:BamA/TamA family outer membrane protein n=1 Tax=Sorangium sp. So ce185 TaxID=3133287 RepID=UPI003F645E4B